MTDHLTQSHQIPRLSEFDSSMSLLLEGYDFIRNRCSKLDTDIFETRLLLKPTICLTGYEASQLFYDEDKFIRAGAAPKRLQKTLFGEHGVQSLDDAEHRHRKALFMSFMTKQSLTDLVKLTETNWLTAIADWQYQPKVLLKNEIANLLTLSICQWSGVPVENQVDQRASQLIELIESAGKLGRRHWQGRKARRLLEDWCVDLIRQVRTQNLETTPDKALFNIAHHRQLDNSLLSEKVAAVELLNIIRPTVAITYYVLLTALALHQYPKEKDKLDSKAARLRFIEEVRRFYPFFPATLAKVRKNFVWKGYTFQKDRKVMLDLFGTNHDDRLWHNPEQFFPDRFLQKQPDSYNLIPQGGGDYWQHHRCAGEWLTQSIMELSLTMLTKSMSYNVPGQNLFVPHNKMPTYPQSGLIVDQVTPLKSEETPPGI